MLASSRKNKEKKLYSSKILYKAPNIYETYKRMVKTKNIPISELNTSRSSIDGLSKRTDNNMTTRNSKPRYSLINLIDSNDTNLRKATKNLLNEFTKLNIITFNKCQ